MSNYEPIGYTPEVKAALKKAHDRIFDLREKVKDLERQLKEEKAKNNG